MPHLAFIRDDVHKLVRLTVCVEKGDLCLEDALHHPSWPTVARQGRGDLVLGAALSGALDALTLRAVGAADALSCPVEHDAADRQSMKIAIGWVASALVLPRDPVIRQSMVSQSMQIHGWTHARPRIEMMIRAVTAVSLHAVSRRPGFKPRRPAEPTPDS